MVNEFGRRLFDTTYATNICPLPYRLSGHFTDIEWWGRDKLLYRTILWDVIIHPCPNCKVCQAIV